MTSDDSTLLRREVRRGPVRRLAIVMIEDSIVSHPLPATGEVIVGRGQDSQIRVDHRSVSRSHLAIELGEVIRIRDLGSANGTSLRGARLPAERAVEVGENETFAIGDVAVVIQERRGLPRPAAAPAARDTHSPSTPIIVDPAMRNLFDFARRIALGSINVLIAGESGSGKELLAEAVHAASPRANGPLVKMNCAAITDSLFESELFGHERGAFTGAVAAKPGLLESAHKGTVFLDEIGELSPSAQSKLLRVIEDRRVQRVGSVEPRVIDVRFVAATHRDLEAAVEAGEFREDLYYRIAGVVLEVPPLRERPSEITALAQGFAELAAVALGRAAPGFTPDAIAALHAHDWPGNVRELRNAIERAVLLASGPISPGDLFADRRGRASPVPADTGDERARIIAALERCAGNQTRAAELLGMPRRTLVKRLVEYRIPRPKR